MPVEIVFDLPDRIIYAFVTELEGQKGVCRSIDMQWALPVAAARIGCGEIGR